MERNQSVRTLVLNFALAAILILPSFCWGQTLEPLKDGVSGSTNEIERIYNLTEVAKTVDDYRQIIRRCEKLLKDSIIENDTKYLESLVAWSRNRLGQRHFLNANSMKKMGLVDRWEEELNNAVEQFDIVIEQHPMTWRSWMGRALIHVECKEYSEALEKFLEVNRLNLKNQKSRFNCAELCFELGQYDRSIEFYD